MAAQDLTSLAEAQPRDGGLLRRLVGLLGLTVVLGAGGAAVVGFLGGAWWFADLFAHFRLQYAALLPIGAVLLLAARRRWLAGLALVLFVANGWALWPHLPHAGGGGGADAVAGQPQRMRIAFANVLTSNRDHAAFLAWVRAEDPDLLLVAEAGADWIRTLRDLEDRWPHRLEAPREDNFGWAVYGKAPLADAAVVDRGTEAPWVRLEMGGVRVFGVHPLPPAGAAAAASRDRDLMAFDARVAAAGERVVLVGDFNATPWSAAMRRLRSATGLRSAADGHWPHPTWFGSLPLLAIPIDHCLVGPALAVREHRVGPDIGSDHRPIAIDLGACRE